MRGVWQAGRTRRARLRAEIPWVPVVHTRPLFVEDDARIGPRRAREALAQARSEYCPFASVGMSGHADPRGVHLRQLGERLGTIRGDVGEIGKGLALRVG